MATAEALLTAEEYAKMPDTGRPTELVRGRVVEMNVPGPWHGYVCVNFAGILRQFVVEHGLGRVMGNDSGVITERGPDTVRGADVCYYSFTRLPRGPLARGYYAVVPELVVEVKSPDQRWRQLHTKVGEYMQAGVSVVLIADPAKQTITIFDDGDDAPRVLNRDAVLSLPDLLPGFSVPVAQFFD